MKIKLIFIISLSIGLIYSCANDTSSEATQEAQTKESPETVDDIEKNNIEKISPTVEGVYENTSGGVLTISNLRIEDGKHYFNYHFLHEGDQEDCNGIDYKETAIYDGNLSAILMNEDASGIAFQFNKSKDSVHFEPSIDMIGMDCARVLDVNFGKKAVN